MRLPGFLAACLLTGLVLVGGYIFMESHRARSARDVEGAAAGDSMLDVEASAAGSQSPSSMLEPTPAPLTSSGWVARNAEGIAALELGDLKGAIEHFEACLAARPEEGVFQRNLAEALTRQATSLHNGDLWDRGRSIDLLERATALDPERKDLSSLLDRYRRSEKAEEGFYPRQTLHFELAFDLNRKELHDDVQTLVAGLEGAYQEYGELFGIRPADQGRAIRVVIYTPEDFSEVTRVGDWAGGVYDGTIRVPVSDLSRELPLVVSVLRHELLHAFVQEAGGDSVPGWLNEGLAQWLERGRRGPGQPDLERARRRMGDGVSFPLEQLQGSLVGWTDTRAIERAYAQSLLLVAHIERHYGGALVYEMVEACADGTPPAELFQLRIGLELDSVLADALSGR